MRRFKIDLSQFGQSFQHPFWRFERQPIAQNTVIEYARTLLESYGIDDQFPTIYLDGAVVPHNECPDLLRDGDLLRVVPSGRSPAIVRRASEISVVGQPLAPEALDFTEPSSFRRSYTDTAVQTPIDNSGSPQLSADAQENGQDPPEMERAEGENSDREDDAEQAGDRSSEAQPAKKRRKRGPRRRVRTKNLPPGEFFEPLTETSPPPKTTVVPEVPQWSGQSTPKPSKTSATEGTLQSTSEKLHTPAGDYASREIHRALLNAGKSDGKAQPTPALPTATVATSAAPVNETPPGGGPPGKKAQPPKMSVKKLAKRAFGVGDILQSLRQNGNGPENEEAARTSNPPGSAVNSVKNVADSPAGRRTEHGKQPENDGAARAARFEDIEVGSHIRTGVTLFSEEDFGMKFFDNVNLMVIQKNSARKQLHVRVISGCLPREFLKDSFKVDWAMLEGTELVTV